jgi:D-alanyl-lipoteichoic acid acyltransferase DltB (MBOAT superfamily)
MRSFGLFVVVIVLAIICAGIGVYYLIPGIYHILLFSISGNPYSYHLKHALIFFALSVVALISVRYVQPLPPEKIKTRHLTKEDYKKATKAANAKHVDQ